MHSPLHLAAYIGDLAQLQETLKDSKSHIHDTVLLCMVPALHVTVCGIAAAVDSVDEYGRTAIMYSTLAEREECVEYLVKKGASLSLQVQCVLHVWSCSCTVYICRIAMGRLLSTWQL